MYGYTQTHSSHFLLPMDRLMSRQMQIKEIGILCSLSKGDNGFYDWAKVSANKYFTHFLLLLASHGTFFSVITMTRANPCTFRAFQANSHHNKNLQCHRSMLSESNCTLSKPFTSVWVHNTIINTRLILIVIILMITPIVLILSLHDEMEQLQMTFVKESGTATM